jgi:two-component system, LytTR family, response regulator
MKLNCVIVDDEPLAVELLSCYAEKTPFLNLVCTYPSAITAYNAIQKKEGPNIDLLFLDIQMPELDGLEFAKLLDPHTRIIFTTAFSQYAIEGFRTNALDYLLKPINYEDFLTAANKALRWFESHENSELTKVEQPASPPLDIIYVKSDYKYVQIKLSDILYIEGLKDYIKIYCENRPKPILTLISMKKMAETLHEPRFMRVHRSFIVQLSKIKVLDSSRIIFGNTEIPISDGYKEKLFQYFNKKTI